MIEDSLTGAISSAQKLGGLNPAAIWALMCLFLMAYLWYTIKQHREYDKTWQDIRIKEAQSDMLIAQSLSKIADEVAFLKVIVDERIPKRGQA